MSAALRKHRNFLAVWPSLLVTSMSIQAILPTLPLYIEERFGITDPAALRMWSGIIYGIAPLAAAIVGPFWGAFGDRYGRRPMVLRAVWSITLVTALMPLATSPVWLMLLRVLQGSLAGYIAPAISLGVEDVPAERQGRTIGRLQLAVGLGLFAGPAIGAEVGVAYGREFVFWAASVLSFVAGIPVFLFARDDHERLRKARAERTRSIVGEVRSLVMQRKFAALFVCILLVLTGQTMSEAFIALWVRELGPFEWATGGGDPAFAVDRTIALAFSILAVAQIAMTPLWGRFADRFGPLRCMAGLAAALGVVLISIAATPTIEGFLGLRCVAAVFMAGSMTLAYAAVGKHVPSHNRALAFALAQSCIQLGLALGPTAGSLTAVRLGLDGMFAVAGCMLLVTAVLVVWLRRREIAVG